MALDMCVCTVFRWFHSTHLVANNTLVGKTCCDREGSVPKKKNDASRNVSHKKSHLDLWRMVRTHTRYVNPLWWPKTRLEHARRESAPPILKRRRGHMSHRKSKDINK